MQFHLPFGLGRFGGGDEQLLVIGARRVRVRFVRHRRARRYVLRLGPDGAARVTIPRGGSEAEAKRFAQRNAGWLERQFLRQAAQPVRAKTWHAGTEILFRGEAVRLEIGTDGTAIEIRNVPAKGLLSPALSSKGREGGDSAFTLGKSLISMVVGTDGDAGLVRFGGESLRVGYVAGDLRPAVERHLRALAARELTIRVMELAALHRLPAKRVTVRNQRSRWGSCSRRGTISLNWRLVQTPEFVCDYIVLHELAHLKEMNHSSRFWDEVARLCPDFERAERWLKEHAGMLR